MLHREVVITIAAVPAKFNFVLLASGRIILNSCTAPATGYVSLSPDTMHKALQTAASIVTAIIYIVERMRPDMRALIPEQQRFLNER